LKPVKREELLELLERTVEELEERIKALTDSYGVIALSSGMAAISNSILALVGSGDNIIASKHLFSHTYSFFESTLKRLNIDVKFVNLLYEEEIIKNVDINTRLIFLETVSNPQLEIPDIYRICEIASNKNIPVILDNTVATPYLFNSKKAGVAVEVLSSTKYISGGATCIGGIIIDNGVFDWRKNPYLVELYKKYGNSSFLMKLRREIYRNFGACLSPHNAWLQLLGLETLSLRIEKSCHNALLIAEYLKTIPKILKVNYPALPDNPFYDRIIKLFNGKGGGLLTFELKCKEDCYKFMDNLKIIRKASNINDNKTLVIHPASTIFSDYPKEKREEMGISEGLLRLSVGIEDVSDLIEDINEGVKVL
ncbi:MAG: PLP-dependent transferase, partial [Chitinispirillaceae bacterium]|nr:PLP-dependent transferase [Chitinispirillaceae bacterium]